MSTKLIISLDIGHSSLRAVLCGKKDHEIQIINTVISDWDADVYEGGRIKNRQAFADAVHKTVLRLDTPCRDIFVTYDGGGSVTKKLRMSPVSEEDLNDAVLLECSDFLSSDVGKYILQSQVLRTSEETQDGKIEVLATAVPSDFVSEIFEILSERGYRPLLFDLHRKEAEEYFGEAGQTVAVFCVGAASSEMTILKDGKYVFQEYVGAGISIFDPYMEQLRDEGDSLESVRSAIKIGMLRERYRSGDLERYEMSQEERAIVGGIADAADEFLDRADRPIRNYLNSEEGARIDRMVLHGEGVVIPDLPDLLESRWGKTVRSLFVRDEDGKERPALLVHAFLLAERINAKNEAERGFANFFDIFLQTGTRSRRALFYRIALFAVLILGLLILGWERLNTEGRLKDELNAVREQLERTPAVPDLEEKIHLLDTLSVWDEVVLTANIRHTMANAVSDELLDGIRAQIPDRILLESFSANAAELVLTGKYEDAETLAQFAEKLEKLGSQEGFESVTLNLFSGGAGTGENRNGNPDENSNENSNENRFEIRIRRITKTVDEDGSWGVR